MHQEIIQSAAHDIGRTTMPSLQPRSMLVLRDIVVTDNLQWNAVETTDKWKLASSRGLFTIVTMMDIEASILGCWKGKTQNLVHQNCTMSFQRTYDSGSANIETFKCQKTLAFWFSYPTALRPWRQRNSMSQISFEPVIILGLLKQHPIPISLILARSGKKFVGSIWAEGSQNGFCDMLVRLTHVTLGLPNRQKNIASE